MNKLLKHILLLLPVLGIVVACDPQNSTTNTTYPEATITSLSFTKNDSFPGLREASFTIITSSDTGLIYNRDSLRFGTRIDSVIPVLTFNHTPSYCYFISDSDTIRYSGSDTINMLPRPTRIYVMASDNQHSRWYDVYVNVHQVDPELYVWENIHSGVFSFDGAESKAFYISNRFFLFVNTGFRTLLYTSADASNWSAPQEVQQLPTNCAVRKMMEANGLLYYPDGDRLLTSPDGITWSINDYSSANFRLLNMLYCYNDSVWAIAQRTSDQRLQMVNAPSNDPGATFALAGEELPDNFPVSDYATLTFPSASDRARAMIMGGYDLQGNSLNTRWNIEFLKNRGYNMANFTVEQPNFEPLTGVSLVWYNHEIHLFGSANKDAEIGEYKQLVSTDEGLNWSVPDSTRNWLPATYQTRQKATVLTTPDNYIYIFGGQSRSTTFSDVWRGRLNKTQFADYQ